MAKRDKIYFPYTAGGLIRYGEEEESKIKLKPEQLIYISVGFAVVLILLRFLLFY
ncbi:MAG: preprotein translocase subunit Sec61beta [Candidatus Aenigmatarchaeota archaeon]|jgi:preprotein translocase subunit Sec61beta